MHIRILLTIALTFLATLSFADTNNEARNVIEDWFAAMNAHQVEKAAGFLAPEFISIHTDGITRNKAAEVKLISHLDAKGYHLSDFQFASSGPDIISVTFKNKGKEKIDNKPIGSGAAPRLAVLQKQNDQWLIIAYANLDTIK